MREYTGSDFDTMYNKFLESKKPKEKINKEKSTCFRVLDELQSSASIPSDFSLQHDEYLVEAYDTSPANGRVES